MRIIIKESGVEYKKKDAPQISTPDDAYEHTKDIRECEQETFCALLLNVKNKLISSEVITLGIATECVIHARELFRQAILSNASSIVLVHNHPSGDTSPSTADMKVTRRLVEAGEIIDIKVLDHVIVGRDGYTSLRESGLATFSG